MPLNLILIYAKKKQKCQKLPHTVEDTNNSLLVFNDLIAPVI